MELDSSDKHLLEKIQQAFPLAEKPFQELGQFLGLDPKDVLARVKDLKARRIIREIGAIFDSRALGYQSTLVAASVLPERLDTVAAVISRHPGVSHNYAREHRYNLWFTLAAPPGENMARTAEKLALGAGADSVMVLPATKVFKIGAFFHLSDEEVTVDGGRDGRRETTAVSPPHLTPQEITVIRELQQDLPVVERPFEGMAANLKISEADVVGRAREFLSRGLMRRFAALLYHRRLGFVANGMGCWRVPPERLEEVGETLAASSQVTHCYQRVTYPQWQYNLFTMVHAPTKEGCLATIKSMAGQVGIADYIVLFSTKEFKKAMVKYYW
ncbi:MAG: Lrp/AsnC family transcriptional regulator [Chloroflexi bacterium]|nr:Lrp/AsnC family transcriptional regulator [Chloroflexota bacterium]